MTPQPPSNAPISFSALHLHVAAQIAAERCDHATLQAITESIHAATNAETLRAVQACAAEAANRSWDESIPFRRSASDIALATIIASSNPRKRLCLFSDLTPVLSGYILLEDNRARYVDTATLGNATHIVDVFDMPNVADMLCHIRKTSQSVPKATMPADGKALLQLEGAGLADASGPQFQPLEFLLLYRPQEPAVGSRFRSLPGIRGSVHDGCLRILATPESMIEAHAASTQGAWFFLRSANIHLVGPLPDFEPGSSPRVHACYVGNDSLKPEPNVKSCLVSVPLALATELLQLHPWMLPMTPMATLQTLPLLVSIR